MKSRATGVDVLTLSATPIPRTLQLSLSGLRDISVIQSPPEGRTPVEVHVRAETLLLETSDTAPDTADTASTDDVIRTALIRELSRGGQVFLVVPYIRDVQPTCERLRGLLPAGARILEAHGQHADLENRVEQFLNKEVSTETQVVYASPVLQLVTRMARFLQAEVLVATTIIESGVDMPNVNTMIVLSAER
jgi:transcription-repair coupling factor (superfamily II helicase)